VRDEAGGEKSVTWKNGEVWLKGAESLGVCRKRGVLCKTRTGNLRKLAGNTSEGRSARRGRNGLFFPLFERLLFLV
jgi:hypothetical protein